MPSVEERYFEEYDIGTGGPPLVQILGPGKNCTNVKFVLVGTT